MVRQHSPESDYLYKKCEIMSEQRQSKVFNK